MQKSGRLMKQCLFMAGDIEKLHNNVIMRNSKSMLLSWKNTWKKSKSVEKIATATRKQIIQPLLCESRQITWEMDQLLPAYNVQVGVADEYIAVVDVNQYRSDMDCFIPLMNKFYTTYGFYPKYPVADAGYGSYNNYIFCEQQGMEKYMKFPMFKEETTDKKYHEDPFRAVNFPIGKDGIMRCPNGKKLQLPHRIS